MNNLKLALNYRLKETYWLKRNCEELLCLTKQQLGLAMSDKKKLTTQQLLTISKTINIPLSFFYKEIEEPEREEYVKIRINNKNILNEKNEVEHIYATMIVCYNTIYKYITNNYTIPKFNKELISVIPDCFLINNNNEIYYCKENENIIKLMSDNFINFFDAKDKYFENFFNTLESNGIIIFSFEDSTHSFNNAQFLLTQENPIIFLNRKTKQIYKRIFLLEELSELLCCKKYGNKITLDKNLKRSFSYRTLLQDRLTNSITTDFFNYQKICRIIHAFNITAECLLTRLKDYNRIDLDDYKIYELSKTIEKYYEQIHVKEIENNKEFDNKKHNDVSTIINKVQSILNKTSKSWEYVANVIGLTHDDINRFCFDIDINKECTIENNLMFV